MLIPFFMGCRGGGGGLLAFYSLLFQLSIGNSEDPDDKGHHAASDLGLSCLLMSQKSDAFITVKFVNFRTQETLL